VFIGYQLRDYEALRAAGKTIRLKVGPWTHVDFKGLAEGVREALDWFDLHLKGRPPQPGELERVRLWVSGADRWRDEPEWPPAKADILCLKLTGTEACPVR